MEVVYSGKQIIEAIDNKIKSQEEQIESYVKTIEYEQGLLTAALKVYNERDFWFKLFNKKPTLRRIRGLNGKYDLLYYTSPEDEIRILELSIIELKRLKDALSDDSQVILKESDIFYLGIKG